jgi:hypothetical protein
MCLSIYKPRYTDRYEKAKVCPICENPIRWDAKPIFVGDRVHEYCFRLMRGDVDKL